MNARLLASSSRQDLEALRHQGIAATDGYAQIRAAAASLSPEHALLFAEPIHNASGVTTDWYTSAEGEIRPFAALSPEEQEWTRARASELAAGVNTLAEQLQSSNEGPKVIRGKILALALRFPDASHIYLVGPQPVVTCWGFAPSQAGAAPENMIRAGAARPSKPATQPTEPAPEPVLAPVAVAAASSSFWWKALLCLLLGLLILVGLLFGAGLLFGPGGCAHEYLQKYVPDFSAGCASKTNSTRVQVPPEVLAALDGERKQEDALRQEIERLRLKLNERAAMCVRKAPEPPVVEPPKPEPVVETPPQEPVIEEPPAEEPPMVAELLPSTPEPPKEEPKPAPKPEPKPKVEPKLAPKPEPQPEPKAEPKPEPKPTPKPRKGEDMVIPEDAAKNNDLSFLEGCWESEVGLVDSIRREPVIVRYCFDKNGRGVQELTMQRGERCVGPLWARFDSSGKLRVNADGAPCNQKFPHGPFVPHYVECTRAADNKADCYGHERDGKGTRWQNKFRRSGDN